MHQPAMPRLASIPGPATPQVVPGQQVTPQPPQFPSSLYQIMHASWQQRPATGPAWPVGPAYTPSAHGAPSGMPAQLVATQATQEELTHVAAAATRPEGQVGVAP